MTKKTRLGDIVEFHSGVGFPNQYQGSTEGEFPFAKVSDISRTLQDGGNVINSAANYVGADVARKLRAKPFPKGTIVFAKIGEAIKKNRRALTTQEMLFDNNVMCIHPSDERTELDYLFRYLDTMDFYKLANATSVPSLRKSVLGDLQIPLPPLDEQKRIAAILDKADQLRQKRRQAIALLDSLTQSIFLEMFGDRIFNSVSGISLGEVTEIQIGPFGSLLHKEDYREDGVPLVNPMHIINGTIVADKRMAVRTEKYPELNRYHLSIGDVVLGRRGEMGRCAVVTAMENGYVCGTGSMFLRPDPSRVRPNFLAALLRSRPVVRHLENASSGVTMPNLNKTVVAEIKVDLPAVDLQLRFADAIDKVATSHKDADVSSGHLDYLFYSLQHRAFSGQL